MPGNGFDLKVKVFNHSDEPGTFIVEPNVPEDFFVEPQITSITVGPVNEGEKAFSIRVPENASPGVTIFTLDVSFENQVLNEWVESVIEILPH